MDMFKAYECASCELKLIYLSIYTLFKVDLHVTLQQKPINISYQN